MHGSECCNSMVRVMTLWIAYVILSNDCDYVAMYNVGPALGGVGPMCTNFETYESIAVLCKTGNVVLHILMLITYALWCGPRITSLLSPRYVVRGDQRTVLQRK